MSDLLHGVANAVRGAPPPLTLWSFHDLPERVAAAVNALELVTQTCVELRSALVLAEAALADIGDADREAGDNVAWCEARAAQALPAVRMALRDRCACGEKPAAECVEEWGPGCDLGNNPAHVRKASAPKACKGGEGECAFNQACMYACGSPLEWAKPAVASAIGAGSARSDGEPSVSVAGRAYAEAMAAMDVLRDGAIPVQELVLVEGAVWEDDGVSLIRRGTEDERCKRRGSQRLYRLRTP
jgi:hypothetical protein